MKTNCYDCKWRSDLVGDAHSCCEHPQINDSDRVTSPMLLFVGMRSGAMKRMNVSGNRHGIEHGWFLWPLNFDPVWLESCDGFERKEVKNEDESKKS